MFSRILRIVVSVLSLLILAADAWALPDRPVPEWLVPYGIPISFGLHAGSLVSGILMVKLSFLKKNSHWDTAVSLIFSLGFVGVLAGPWIFNTFPDYLTETELLDDALLVFSLTASTTWLAMATSPLWNPWEWKARRALRETFS